MKEKKFKTGNHVMLKSGGPVMTIISTNGDKLRCEWVDGKGNVHSSYFHHAIIIRIPIKTTINIPKGCTSVEVEIDGANYPLILHFNDPRDTRQYFLENGKYDGHDHKCKEDPK